MTTDAFSTALANAYNGEKTRQGFNKYSAPGSRCGGTVVSRDLFQATDPKTRQKKTWDDGNPVMKAVIVVQTDAREDADDDGQRAIYVNWYGDDLRNLKAAIGNAGDDDLRIGGWFGAVFTREEPPAGPGLNGRKVYEYTYQKPAFINSGQPAAAEPAPPVQTAAAPQPAYSQGGQLPPAQPAQQQHSAQYYAQAAANGPAPAAVPAWANQQAQTPPQTAQNVPAWANTQPPAAQPPQTAQPPAQPAPGTDPAIINLISQGFTDEDIAATTGAQLDQIRAARGQFQ